MANKSQIKHIHSIEEYNEFHGLTKKYPSWKHKYEWNLDIHDANNPKVRELFGDIVCILDTFKRLYKQYVQILGYEKVYKLIGVQITDMDYYWILKSGWTTKYVSCLAKLTPVNESE